jgi:hypothetical protein
MKRPQGVSLLSQSPDVLMVVLAKRCFMASRAKFQHRSQQFGRLPTPQRLHLVQSRNLLVVRKLVRIQEALLKRSVREPLRRMLYHVQNEADGLLGEGRDQVIVPRLLPCNAVKPEMAFRQHKPTDRLVHPERREAEAVEASWPSLGEVDEILVLHEGEDSAKNAGSPM